MGNCNHELRMGKVTASRLSDVMAKGRDGKPSATRKNYMADLLVERLTNQKKEGFTSKEIERGNELEAVARSWYEVETGSVVEECDFIDHPSIPMFGASPDGLVGLYGMTEYKVPNTATHIETMTTLKIDGGYKWQMFGQMACCERKWNDFVSFDDRLPDKLQGVIIRLEWDGEKIEEMESEVKKFLLELDELESRMREKMK